MSISSISGTNLYQANQISWQNNIGQRQQGFKVLASALQSGDLSGAQQAFAALQQLQPNFSAAIQTQNGQQGSVQNPLTADFSALGQALQKGDLDAAKTAFAKLLQDMRSVRQGHHHHHHHKVSASTESTASTTSSASVGSTTGSGGSGQNGSVSGGINISV